jgi:hypothetical protein
MNPKTDLGRLLPVDLRDVLADEAKDFTPWLAQSVEVQTLHAIV